MKSIEFYDLARPAQERFVAATRATLAPAPLAVRHSSKFVGSRWFLTAALGVVTTAAFASRGFGDLQHPAALASGWRAVIYCLGFTASFACLTRGLTLRDRALSLPFTRGVYLFPSGVVEATSSGLNVHSLQALASVNATANSLEVQFDEGATFSFPANSLELAQAAHQAVIESQSRLNEATATDSVRQLAALDPLCYTDHPSPFSQNIPFQRPTSLWSVALLTMAAVSGAALGVGLWKVRNTLSEHALIDSAKQANTTGAFRDYIARGGRDQKITEQLLPRAELAEAQGQSSVGAIEKYIATHPDSKIEVEVQRALRNALMDALQLAIAPGTLAALGAFESEFPRHQPIQKDLDRARHAVYAKAADSAASASIKTKRPRSDAAGFFRHLVAYAEGHSPEVQIRFRGQLGMSAQGADVIVRRSRYFGGNVTLPRRHFRGKRMKRREKMTTESLITALQPLFPPEIIHFTAGAALPALEPDATDRTLPEVTVPTLFVGHRTELSGGTVNLQPRGIFMGAGIFFEAIFVIPGQKAKLTHRITTWQSPSRQVLKLKKRSTGDVYEHLARRSFSQFLRKYLPKLLAQSPDVTLPELALPQPSDH